MWDVRANAVTPVNCDALAGAASPDNWTKYDVHSTDSKNMAISCYGGANSALAAPARFTGKSEYHL
jgi:hypothetical protein